MNNLVNISATAVNRAYRILGALIALLAVALLMPARSAAQWTLSTGATFTLTNGAIFAVNGDVTIGTSATFTQLGTGMIYLRGSWFNNGLFVPGTGTVLFETTASQTLGGMQATTFYHLTMTKGTPAALLQLDQSATVGGTLTLTQGTLRFLNNAPRTLQLAGDLTIPTQTTVDVQTGGATVHTIALGGSIANSNILNLNPGGSAADVSFTGAGNATIDGTGSTTNFRRIVLDKASQADTVRVHSAAFGVPATGFLHLNTGTMRLSGSYTLSNPVFTTATYAIPATAGLWLDNAAVTVTGQNGSASLGGLLRLTAGAMTVGTAAGQNHLLYSSGSRLMVEGGQLTVSGRLSRDGNNASAISYSQSAGTVAVGAEVVSSATDRGVFDIAASGSSFTWTGGSIELNRHSLNAAPGGADYWVGASTFSVTTGTVLRINAAAAAQNIRINTVAPVGQLFMSGTNDAVATLLGNPLTVLGDITIAGSGAGRLNANGQNIALRGDWINNGTTLQAFTPSTAVVTFNGTGTQRIRGAHGTAFYHVTVGKQGSDTLRLGRSSRMDGTLRLLTNTVVDIDTCNLTIGPAGAIYTDNSSATAFSASRTVYSSRGASAGFLYREIPAGAATPYNLLFPIGTPGVYTPADVTFLLNRATFSSGAFVGVKAVPQEHPSVERTGIALAKYWVVTSGNIALQPEGANVLFYYSASESRGNEGSYVVLYYAPSHPDPAGFWRLDPGQSDDVVDFNSKLFYSQQVAQLDGDWTAGEAEAGAATYFSRANGDYNTPSTWSKINFNGPPSTTAPNKQSDKVRIQGHTVTVSSTIASVNSLAVEQNATLRIAGNYAVRGDTMRVLPNAVFANGHSSGVAAIGAVGAVQTTVRDLSPNAVYVYDGTGTQLSGDGLPSPVRSLVVSKSAADTLRLSTYIAIADSLVINNGVLDISSYSIDGNSAGRTLTMRNGELLVRSAFPNNYSTPSFTAGTITFNGTGNTTIPSAASVPAVAQYNNLRLGGQRNGVFTLAAGQIRIGNQFDLSTLQFTGSQSQRFFTDGSTVVFNGTGAQNIPCRPQSPADSIFTLPYYNLVIAGSGTKQLSATTATTFVVLNDLTIQTGATLSANGFDLELQHNWVNAGGVFLPGTRTVYFRSTVPLATTYVTSRDIAANPFHHVQITGQGAVTPLDNMIIQGNLTITTSATLSLTTTTLTLYGNWTNQGAFTSATSTVVFNGVVAQQMTRTSGSEEFYNLTVQNTGGVNAVGVGATANDGVVVNGTLHLIAGNLVTRGRFARANGPVLRTGSASPGHVDGPLRKPIAAGASSTLYEVGYGRTYTPVTFAVNGTGGTAGPVSVESDTVSASSSPVTAGINPTGSGMNDARHVRRQWKVTVPSGSAFALGTERSYDATFAFVPGAAPAGDLRGGADPLFFETRMWNGSSWVAPNRFDVPRTGTRTASTTQMRLNKTFGTFIVGEPTQYSFYSIADGPWSTPSNWSTQDYGGIPTTVVPTATAMVYIGDSKTITLTANTTMTGAGTVTVDSSGRFLMQNFVLSGTGSFRLEAEGAVGIGHASGITASGAAGNVQTTTRQYNPGSHDRGHFIYTDNATQATGDGLPATVKTLTVQKAAGTPLTLGSTLAISDSLHIASGTVNASSRTVTARGNVRVGAGAVFTPQTSTVVFAGSTTQTVTAQGATLQFNNLTISKSAGAGNVVLSTGTTVQIGATLLFASGNAGTIDARTSTGAYVTALGTVTRTGAGHVDGELRKTVPAGAATVFFEVGEAANYTPYTFQLGGTGGTAGLLAMQVIPGKHPYLDDSYVPPIDPERYIPRYWRLTQPPGSAFARGTRTMTITLQFLAPNDLGTVDGAGCVDMAYWKGLTNRWQALYPDGTGANYNAGYSCGDSRLTLGTIDYTGSASTVTVNLLPVDTTLGSNELLDDGSLLLGEFVTGNQNSIVITTYYSRQNGNWSDPNTWSTVSYNGPAASGYPRTQYDIVLVGNGRRVQLNENIGTARLYGDFARNQFYGPAVTVEATGTLAFGAHILRGVTFTAKKGCTLEIGSASGLSAQNTWSGNVMSDNRTIEDSLSVVYTADGYTPVMSSPVYCRPSMDADDYYIERVRLRDAGNTLLMDNNTGTTLRNDPACFYFPDKSATLTAGQQYSIQLNQEGSGSRRWTVWIDYDLDGQFEDNYERVITGSFSSDASQTQSFTVPAGGDSVLPGVTHMRVMLKSGSGTISACTEDEGEIEDYTVRIVKDSRQVAQATGSGMPSNLASLEVNSSRTTVSSVTLGKNITVRDSVKMTQGYFYAGGNTIDLSGDFIGNYTGGFNAQTSTLRFINNSQQTVRGSVPTTFNNVTLNKTGGRVTLATNATITAATTFSADNILVVSDNVTLTFGASATVSAGAGAFSNNRMIRVSGSSGTGLVQKQFTTAAGAKSFLYPLGIDTVYNPASISVTGSYTATPSVTVRLFNGRHPNRLSDRILKKYWNIATSNISNITANALQFTYAPVDTAGNGQKYIPAQYQAAQWEINVGTSPAAVPSPITITNSPVVTGDWTAGEATGFFLGRIFYSRATGNWNTPSNWSNIGHAGVAASYYPGQLFERDTVLVDGHTITFNVDSVAVDTLQVGGSFNGTAAGGRGILSFGSSPLVKVLTVRNHLRTLIDGQITGTSGAGRRDTVRIRSLLTNDASAASSAGIFMHSGANDHTTLRFESAGTSRIAGEGVWGPLAGVRIAKTGLADTLINTSASFAGATGSVAQYRLDLDKGVLRQQVTGATLSLSYGAATLQMQSFTGLDVWSGGMRSSSGVITNVNTTIRLNGGDLSVGDAADEHLFYKTGTRMSVLSGRLDVAGCLARDEAPSLLDLTVAPSGTIRVLSRGNTDPAKIGFDISNSASTFSMSGGRIIIAGGTSGAVADYNVSASAGTGMTGGVLQTGDTALTTPGTVIKVVGTMPIWNWQGAGSGVISQVAGQVVTVANNVSIDDNHTMRLRGNTLQLGGNLTNYGTFDPVTGSTPVEPRLLVANGTGNQVFFNDDAGGLTLYNFRVEKSAGRVTLAAGGNSDLTVNNTLEFAVGNTAVIDARTNARSVIVTPSGAGTPQVLRSGTGHVDGRLYRYVGTGVQSIAFAVGTSATVGGYTPAVFETVGTGGTAGLVGVIAYGTDHPRITEATVRTDNNIQRYWNVTTASGFALASRSFTLTTQFINPGDLRNNPNILFFEHYRYAPACPDAPASCPPGTGTWSSVVTQIKTDTTIISQGNTAFGDVIIAEPAGYTFYSIADGAWDDVNTWSMESYTGSVAPRIPDQGNDIIRIGNGRSVTIPPTLTPQVRAVIVERFNHRPGALYINGNLGYIRGLSFVLEDSCTLGMQHLNGIAPNGTVGAVQMDSRSFGVGRFVYNSIYGGQNSGRALPDSIAALIVDNPSANVNTLYITNYAGAPTVRVRDSIHVERGTFSSGGRNIILYGDMVMRNNGVFTPLSADFTIAGPALHRITLDNTDGVTYNNLQLTGNNVLVTSTVSSATAQVYIGNQLLFSTGATVNVRAYDRRVVMATGATVARPLNVGFVDGTLRKPFGAGAGSILFEIGNDTAYTPATLTFSSTSGTGTAGAIDAINLTPVPPEPFVGNRMDTAVFVPRYWRLTAASGFSVGPRTLNTLFGFPASEAAVLDLPRTVIRRRSLPVQTPMWRDRRNLTWNVGAATVELAGIERPWEGLGEFFIGQKAQRIFYSRGTGAWDDPNSWSFYGHNGVAVPAGEYPNPDWNMSPEFEFETRDSVVIGDNDVITLNTQPELAYVEIAPTGTLVVDATRYLSATALGGSAFILRDGATLDNRTGLGIEPGLNGIIRFGDADRTFEPAANYRFSGALDQYFGGAFPTTVNNITVTTDNNTRNVFINRSGVVVNGALDIASGILQFDNTNASGVPTDQTMTLNGDMTIATGATLTVETAGSGPRSHTLDVNGDVVNNGSWIMCPVPGSGSIKAETVFGAPGTQTITGTGGTTRLYGVTLDKGDPAAVVNSSVDIEISRVGGPAMTFSAGTWEQSAGTLTLDGCAPATTQTITAGGALHLTGSGSLSQKQTLVLDGGELLLNTSGLAQIGTAAGHNLVYENSSNSRLTIMDGALDVAGRIGRGDTPGGDVLYTQSGGTVTVGIVGVNSATHGTFEMTAGSSFAMSDGAIVLRTANASSDPARPADFTLLAGNTSITGGTTQFGDALTPPSTLFDYNVGPSIALWDLAVSTNATVVPRNPDGVLRLQGDIINDGVIDATVTRSGAPAASSTIVFQGGGADDQTVTGPGTTTLQNLTMNRDAGTGVVTLGQTITVEGVLDLREGGNPNSQIIALPSTTANLLLTNCTPSALADAGTTAAPYRYIRTDNTGGQLIRTICPSGVYLYPVGSFDAGQDNYTPATLTAGPTGASGTVGVRVSRGAGAQGGHAHLRASATDYLQRYWAVANVTTTIPGEWRFDYLDGAAHVSGSEANFTRVGRWRPAFEAAGGSWAAWNNLVNTSANFFTAEGQIAASEYMGDWTVGGDDVFRRIFYSLMTGQWSSPASWTFSPTHSGPMAGPGVWPNDALDSVVVGGGSGGVNNHVIQLDGNVTVGGLALGTSTANTGTLMTNGFVVSGETFSMGDNSTLGIGSADGIAIAPVTAGNIQTTVRRFSTTGTYVYNGTTDQRIGTGLPGTIGAITVDNRGPAGNNTVLLDRSVTVSDALSVLTGVLDMQTFALNNPTGMGICTLAGGTTLRLGGTSSLSSAAAGYDAYSIDAGSTVEFYGSNQTVPPAPNSGVGYGHVVVSGAGQKLVSSPVRVRGNLSVRTGSLLDNQVGVNSLEVLGTVFNDGTLTNSGTIQIGN